ncbi:MAG: YeeE/YedE family protein [Proteobacteria bacterium]|nr:YeeE/YedE family protein [Pseudomonadota bacterium]
MEPAQIANLVVWCGIGLGTLFGLVANRCNFCTMGAVSDIVNMGDWGRMRSWLLAIAVGILGTNLLGYFGYLDLGKTAYTGAVLPWLAYIVGGACFGVGMTLASGCGNKTMVRIGSGNLKSLVVLVFFGLAAMMTMKGVLGVIRLQVLQAPLFVVKIESGQSLPAILASLSGGDLKTMQLLSACALALLIAIFVFRDSDFRQNFDNKLAGIFIGLVITAGWYVTGHIGLAENPDTLEMTYFGTNSRLAESMSFTGPTAYFLELLSYWSDTSSRVSFGIATLIGVAIGSFIYAMRSHSFRLEHFSTADDMLRHIAGAVLMGFGGVTAAGCSIGQGLTGVTTLSLGSYLVFFSIIAGAATTMKIQYHMMMREAEA